MTAQSALLTLAGVRDLIGRADSAGWNAKQKIETIRVDSNFFIDSPVSASNKLVAVGQTSATERGTP